MPMPFLSLTETPLGQLADSHGWFSVTTPLRPGGTIRTIVYIDGDVTTKLIDTRTVDAESIRTHFDEIDRQTRLVKTRLRNVVVTITTTWLVIAIGILAIGHDLASLAAAIAMVVPIAVNGIQRRLRTSITLSGQTVAAVGAAIVIVAAVAVGRWSFLVPATATFTLNMVLIGGIALARARLRTLLRPS